MVERMRGPCEGWEEFSDVRILGLDHPEKIAPVTIIAHGLGKTADIVGTDVTHPKGNLFGTGNLEPLATLEHVHERAGFQQRLVRPGIEPRGAAPKDFDRQPTCRKIAAIEIGDFQLAAGRWLE